MDNLADRLFSVEKKRFWHARKKDLIGMYPGAPVSGL